MARAAGQPALTPPRPIEDLIDHLSEVTDGPVDPEEVRRALTHRSFAYEAGGVPHNERLEFLGDAVLGVIVTQTLYHRHPDLPEGQLAKLRSAVVNMRALAEVGRTLGLGDYLFLGRGEESTGGRDKDSILADTMEAVIGAAFLAAGPEAAGALVLRLVQPLLEDPTRYGAAMDPKTSLQELAARLELPPPTYDLESDGPDHSRLFTATVTVGDVSLHGQGTSKKQAQMAAALAVWRELTARS